MKIALYNLEPHIFNVAMMKVSQYHKQKGDIVEVYNPFQKEDYDKIYAFSIFDFTDKSYVTKDMICGGTGFDISVRLPEEIDNCDYDYSIFPQCDYSMIWFSKGCIRNCKWCVVRRKEGIIQSVIPKNLNSKGQHIKVMDNNFFANPKWREAIKQLQEWKQPVDFQGVDVRLLDEEKCKALNSLKHYKQIHIAWDDPEQDLLPKLKEVIKWIKPYKLMCYVLIGYNSTEEQDIHRIESLRSLKIDPFVMPFNKQYRYQKDFARWVNHKAIFRKVAWKDYKKKEVAGCSADSHDGIPSKTKVLGILPNEL